MKFTTFGKKAAKSLVEISMSAERGIDEKPANLRTPAFIVNPVDRKLPQRLSFRGQEQINFVAHYSGTCRKPTMLSFPCQRLGITEPLQTVWVISPASGDIEVSLPKQSKGE